MCRLPSMGFDLESGHVCWSSEMSVFNVSAIISDIYYLAVFPRAVFTGKAESYIYTVKYGIYD